MTTEICLVMFGQAGGGKSTLCNTLSGTTYFQESDETECETKVTVGHSGSFDGQRTFVIDTPGLDDTDRQDTPHLVQMAQYIKSNKSARAFVIVLNFHEPRLANKERRMFELMQSMFPGRRWYRHIAVVYSHCEIWIPEAEKTRRSTKAKEGFRRFIRKYFPEVPETEIAAIPQKVVDSIDARTLGNNSASELSDLLTWAVTREPLEEIRVKESVTQEKRTRTEGDSVITEEREVTKTTDGKTQFGPWKEVHRITTHKTVQYIYESSSGICTVV